MPRICTFCLEIIDSETCKCSNTADCGLIDVDACMAEPMLTLEKKRYPLLSCISGLLQEDGSGGGNTFVSFYDTTHFPHLPKGFIYASKRRSSRHITICRKDYDSKLPPTEQIRAVLQAASDLLAWAVSLPTYSEVEGAITFPKDGLEPNQQIGDAIVHKFLIYNSLGTPLYDGICAVCGRRIIGSAEQIKNFSHESGIHF